MLLFPELLHGFTGRHSATRGPCRHGAGLGDGVFSANFLRADKSPGRRGHGASHPIKHLSVFGDLTSPLLELSALAFRTDRNDSDPLT